MQYIYIYIYPQERRLASKSSFYGGSSEIRGEHLCI